MIKVIIGLLLIIAMLFAVCFIGSLILAKDTKEFHIHFGLLNGFDISGSFYDNNVEKHQ